MSNAAIRRALETRLGTVNPALATAWENVDFDPPGADTPYQIANTMFAAPENPTMGQRHYRQRGIFQISLQYPTNEGPGAAQTRAELLRNTFFRGLSIAADGVTTIVDRTPEVATGAVEGDRYVINIRIRFYADIFNGA